MHQEFGLLLNLSVSLVLALALGFLTDKLRLSPIVGYLLAGFVLGHQTPGFVADPEMAGAFAELGVVLLMFGVGLHFDVGDLLAVKWIAVPGSVGQILVAATLGTAAAFAAGWGLGTGLVLGLAISVASTVVLVRVLVDNDALDTSQGHIAVGWLIVEDLFTVLVLVVLPAMAAAFGRDDGAVGDLLGAVALAVLRIGILAALVLVLGRKAIPWLLTLVARSRSRELFTLGVLALALAIATGSAMLFGVSMALGAFLAGMVVGQSDVSHQAAADALPMRDAFAVLFFVSVGMLFDAQIVTGAPWLLLAVLAIILIAKPLTAILIIWALRYSVRTALTVAVGLAQIGEFSFVLGAQAVDLRLVSPDAQSLLVACALISITANPLLFRAIDPFEKWLRGRERIWRAITRRSEARGAEVNIELQARLARLEQAEGKARAVVVGYGPVGQTACRILKEFQIEAVIVDLNLDTVRNLTGAGRLAIYGDATRPGILNAAGIGQAKYLLVTIPDLVTRTVIILTAKNLNPEVRVFARARYLQERAWLEEVGATAICTEEAETALALAELILREFGADAERIQSEIRRIRQELSRVEAEA